MAYKKKLYRLNPEKPEADIPVEIQKTKRKKVKAKITPSSNERYFREALSNKVSGSHMGLWLLVPEYLRLGAWDLVRGLFDGQNDIPARLGMQMVNESALCVNRVRKKDSLCHQGFSLTNGLSFLATDESIHRILDNRSVMEYEHMQRALMQIRKLDGHYGQGTDRVFSIDPHRINSTTKRMMPRKKKKPGLPSSKMMQTFFCIDTNSGQPLAFTQSASGKTCSRATLELMDMIEQSFSGDNTLVLADKEHFTREIADYFLQSPSMDILMPVPRTKRVMRNIEGLSYRELWPGYYMGETEFQFGNSDKVFRLIVQKESVKGREDAYKPFITTSSGDMSKLITEDYPKRWTIEEFFNLEGDMGWNRASTFNLNVRYGKQSLALIAQAAVYGLRKKLPGLYKNYTAAMISEKVLTGMEGDIRVKGDTIIVTYYKDHEVLGLRNQYSNMTEKLQKQGIPPKIPWLFDYKLEFRFK